MSANVWAVMRGAREKAKRRDLRRDVLVERVE